MSRPVSSPRIVAILGPTNTGKTYLAMERLSAHASGMIGFPLRLLARENYDRLVAQKGRHRVALITGEEKLIPPRADYFICTVEAMPMDRVVAFLAVDEIQLAGDPERGHIFTQRLLHARGSEETMFLGAATVGPLLRRLVPEAEHVSRPRFSVLSYDGVKKIHRLPRRSAVVAFSAADVYAHAEHLRRRRGGCAVVLGALSPRTRNAQVAMFQSGEVDFMVATDAIGMGLNMDLDHVCFAGLEKFDGNRHRPLDAAEIAQIAGRAGRHMSDGHFSVMDGGGREGADRLSPESIAAVENHDFPALRALYWRNSRLDDRSLAGLLASLSVTPPHKGLRSSHESEDHLTLLALSQEPAITARTTTPANVRLLWETCQIPDFRKTLSDTHIRLVARIFGFLTSSAAVIPAAWMDRQINTLNRVDGDIDTLTARLAHIRTLTYLSHRPGWLADTARWRGCSRAVEDRLSDALHQRLTQRFVERRVARLARRWKEGDGDMAPTATLITEDGRDEVDVDGVIIGHLAGFRFIPAPSANHEDHQVLMKAGQRFLEREGKRRLAACLKAPDSAFTLDESSRILWRQAPVAYLRAGSDILTPVVEIPGGTLAPGLLGPDARRRLQDHLAAWLRRRLDEVFAPLLSLEQDDLPAPARGLVFQLREGLGSVERRRAAPQLRRLDRASRRRLRARGVVLGPWRLTLPPLLSARVLFWRGVLWSLFHLSPAARQGRPPLAPELAARPASAQRRKEYDDAYYRAMGYGRLGGRVVRDDVANRLANRLHQQSRTGPIALTPALASAAGCPVEALPALLAGLGYKPRGRDKAGSRLYGPACRPRTKHPSRATRHPPPARRHPAEQRTGRDQGRDAASPFAALSTLFSS